MISVIIPVYNAEGTLSNMLSCLQRQTEKHFEVWLIDDGSTDGSGRLGDQIAKQDSRFFCIHQANQGVSSARNRGIELARGDYIAFLDADDEIDDNYLQVLLETISEAEISVCTVNCERKGGIVGKCFSPPNRNMSAAEAMELLLCREGINSGPCAKLFRRAVIGDLRFPSLKAYEDLVFVKDVFAQASRIAATTDTCYHYQYTEHENGAMHLFFKAPSHDILVVTKDILAFLNTHRELSPRCAYVTISHLMQYVLPLAREARPEGRLLVKDSGRLLRTQWWNMWKNRSFPWKEKVFYTLFSLGIDFKR